MNTLWTQSEILAAIPEAILKHPFQATGVSIDTRTLKPGDLFVALKGETFDGHDFVAKAIELGASAAIVDHIPATLKEDYPFIVVKDTLKAMEQCAKFVRKQHQGTIIGLTGSLGKTTTKTMIAYLLDAYGNTYATEGNLNNHIGVPLTMMRIPRDNQYAIIEMGMNHAGEIRHLSKIAQPHIALITTIDAVHLEFFGTVDNIAKAKSEIFEGLINRGTAIVPFDSPYLPIMDINAKQWGAKDFITFGEIIKADLRMIDYSHSTNGSRIKVQINDKEYEYHLGLVGKHMAMNSLAALSVIYSMGLDVEKAMHLLQGFSAVPGRGKTHHLKINNKPFTLIDDSYNASPASIRAAIGVLSHVKGRKIAVLGDMLELGERSEQLHGELGWEIARGNIDLICTAGPLMQTLYAALPRSKRGPTAPTAEALYPELLSCLKKGDTLLVKGSHGSKVHTIVKKLLQDATPVEL